MNYFLRLNQCQPRLPELQFREQIDWTLYPSETWAIVGSNGSGKSILINLIAGRHALRNNGEIEYDPGKDVKPWRDIQVLTFDSVYGLADFRNSYYQQRWHSTEANEMPPLRDIIKTAPDEPILSLFGIDRLLDKKINYLSSGELRKFLVTKALLDKPKLLIIDNPYIGLDVESRKMLRDSLKELSLHSHTQVIFVLPDNSDIPDFVTDILPIENRKVYPSIKPASSEPVDTPENINAYSLYPADSECIVEMHDVKIRYGEKIILDGIDWQIRKGEKWVLSGPNGSGKSTLLSLINADHPQAYANDIKVFGHQRGAGQSIWDIKKRIGYASPEMHTHYYQHIPAIDVVGSGLFDTVGTVHRCNDAQIMQSRLWMERLGIGGLADRSFMKLSSGEQRLVLLARAFVKEPELLILDEPLHGLDAANKTKALDLIEDYASRPEITLIYVTHYSSEIPPCVRRSYELGK